MMRVIGSISVLLGFLAGVACKWSKSDSALLQQCDEYCGSIGCGGDPDSATIESCMTQCMNRRDEAKAVGKKCEVSYLALMECIGVISDDCELATEWALGDLMSEEEFPCRSETEEFVGHCPEVWFAAEP